MPIDEHPVDEQALNDVAGVLAQKKNVVFVTGAGISVASGIAPYRKTNDAIWENFITDWGTVEKLLADPRSWWLEFWLKAHKHVHDVTTPPQPNAGHHALSRILQQHPGHQIITQNIDGLHRQSGAPRDRLIEIHGRADQFICTNSQCSGQQNPVGAVDLTTLDDGEYPECEICGRPMRPLVLLFDEMYDSHPAYRAREARRWLNDAEALVFVGTSLSVGITDMALRAGRYQGASLIYLNISPVEESWGPGFLNLLGRAEQTLPLLAARLGA